MPSKFKVGDIVIVKGTRMIRTIDRIYPVKVSNRSRSLYTTRPEGIHDWERQFYSSELEKFKPVQYEEMM